MKFFTKIHIPFPRSLVYTTYRDTLVQLVPYMPNVRRIELVSQQEGAKGLKLVHEWHGGGEIPGAMRTFLSEELLSWTNYATWNDAAWTTDWRNETHTLKEAVSCAGTNRFLEDGKGTLVESSGQLLIESDQLHAVPRLMRGMVAHAVEDILGKQIEPNFLQMGNGVRRYLEEHSATP
jgi:hypothetical protein